MLKYFVKAQESAILGYIWLV